MIKFEQMDPTARNNAEKRSGSRRAESSGENAEVGKGADVGFAVISGAVTGKEEELSDQERQRQ